MTNSPGMRIALPPPTFPQGPSDDFALETPTSTDLGSPPQQGPPRVSFSHRAHRFSLGSRYRGLSDEELGGLSPTSERPPIPSALPIANTDSTPLPRIPMIVLSVAVLGEFLSANVSTSFLKFMVEGFDLGDDAELGTYIGMITSAFFITQFLTSLLWATVANKHGNRAVLFVALLGNALTCALFGTCTTLPQAIAVRLIQGVFNGAVGVARSTVANVTDPSNEGRAYAIMGFSWGLGGVSGAIIGGFFESPEKKWPNSFGRVALFRRYPYLLPCLIASSVLFMGACLSTFLAPDGGPREGAIRLGPEKVGEEEQNATPIAINMDRDDGRPLGENPAPAGPLGQLKKQVSKRLSGYFARRVLDAHHHEDGTSDPLTRTIGSPRARAFSRTSRANGSAYGYRTRLGSQATFASGIRRESMASTATIRRRGGSTIGQVEPSSVTTGDDLNFAQRLLMANEFTANSLTTLWVAAAINVDNEDPFIDSDDEGSEFSEPENDGPSRSPRLGPISPPSPTQRRKSSAAGGRVPSFAFRQQNSPLPHSSRRLSGPGASFKNLVAAGDRRFSSSVPHLQPAIYANPGVNTPPALLEGFGPSPQITSPQNADPFLAPIMEGGPTTTEQPDISLEVPGVNEKQPSLLWQLPLFLIAQYFALALHNTIHDTVFYMYLTEDYVKGGLQLDAGHFAQLIALMFVAQIIYQFYLYPNIGPPRGKFSHLAMFRIGAFLFIPSYLSVTLYRVFASSTEEGNPVVMTLLAISTAVRFAGATFSYTSMAVLLNYMSPPHVISFTNGLAQSMVSLARVLGPLLGGFLWSFSIMDNPSGYPLGFYVCTIFCALAIFTSFFIQ